MSQDVFQMRMDQILEKCPGVIGIHDDVVIYGKTREEHDSNLVNFLNVCKRRDSFSMARNWSYERSKLPSSVLFSRRKE